jgi:uncharacterized protein
MLKTLLGAATALTLTLAYAPERSRANPVPQTAPAAAMTDADPALWVIRDADTTIYLFGTIHVLKPGLSWFDEAVKDAFDKSDQLVLEIVMPEPAAAQAAIMKYGINPTGPTLTERLPEARRAGFLATASSLGLPQGALDRADPWFASMQLTMIGVMKAGYNPADGVELTLAGAAAAAKKPVAALETLDQQFGFFDGLSDAAQMSLLTMTLDEMPKLTETFGTMVADWAEGDPDALGKLISDGMRQSPETAKVLLGDRNARWAEWIEQRMARPGTVFIAVGAGHLAGDDSVQAFLAKRKLKAERVAY